MKKIRLIELGAHIKTNFVAFLSISMFVALGMALFLGIQWSSVALSQAMDRYFESGNTHDIEISFPYGITEENIAELKKIDGVDNLETSYSGYAVVEQDSARYVMRLETAGERIDKPTVLEGSLPTKKGQVALVSWCAEKQGLKLGDTVKLKHDATNKDDKDGMSGLTTDELTVCGLVEMPNYSYKMPGSLGVSNIGSGQADLVGLIAEETFDTSTFKEGYPVVRIRSNKLDGLETISQEYRDASAPIVGAITKLGGTLGLARFNNLRDEAKNKLDEVQAQIDDGEKQLEDGEKLISDGEKQLEEGKQKVEDGSKLLEDGQQQLIEGTQELVDGRQFLAESQLEGQRLLDEAYALLRENQTKYDLGLTQYNSFDEVYEEFSNKFNQVVGEYDTFIQYYSALESDVARLDADNTRLAAAIEAYDPEHPDQTWGEVEAAYQAVTNDFKMMYETHGSIAVAVDAVCQKLGIPLSIEDIPAPDIPELVKEQPEEAKSVLAISQEATGIAHRFIDRIEGASINIQGITLSLKDIPGGLAQMLAKLTELKAQLDAGKAQLDAGWEEYNTNQQIYEQKIDDALAEIQAGQDKVDAGRAEVEYNRQQLEEGRKQLEEKTQELEEGKKQLAEKQKELEDGKKQFEEGKEQFAKMVEYEWVVTTRADSGPATGAKTMSGMMGSMRWAMASLFIIVGLFVCYSAVSRLVHEQIIAIGTKKALGFREGEITMMYLGFTGLSTLLGWMVALLLAIFLVEGVVNPTVSRQFAIGDVPIFFSMPELIMLGGIEFVLIAASTWVAVHGLLKREALDLLRGESTANVKKRFYEEWGIWRHMSLFSQTIVNNCVNDPRRVAGTIIGVMGCTALIVTAVTLNDNVAKSIQRQYDEIYHFDSIAYLTDASDAEHQVAMGLYDQGISSSPVFLRKLQVRKDDGSRSISTLVVPTNMDAFKKYYGVLSTAGGTASIEEGGLWLSSAYGDHMGAKVGDEITLTEYTGKAHTFKIAGFFEYYVLRQEFVLCAKDYEEAFGEKPVPNALYVRSDGSDISQISQKLLSLDGFQSIVDDHADATYAFNEMKRLLTTVVLIYLGLSALMALMVLLNLDIMYVEEKKRELIVLMINGFSVRDAQSYISRDSIVLTIVGIVIGIVLGSVVGSYTVAALEPEFGTFLKGFNPLAAVVGALGAGVFAIGVLLYALGRVKRFNLTDINRF